MTYTKMSTAWKKQISNDMVVVKYHREEAARRRAVHLERIRHRKIEQDKELECPVDEYMASAYEKDNSNSDYDTNE